MGQTESTASEPPRRHSNGPQSRQKKLSTASACPSIGGDSSASNSPSLESFLTQRQKVALQKSWKKSPRTGIDNIGSQIFMKIYMRDRTVGRMFGMEKVPLHELKYQKFFQSHAATFTKSLDFIVANLDNVPAIRRFCRRLGKSHIKYIERGFKLEYWDIFAEALTECAISWEGGIRCRDILIGWRKLISFVIEEMRVTFLKEKRERFLNGGTPSDDADSNPDSLNVEGISLESGCPVPKWNAMEACPMSPLAQKSCPLSPPARKPSTMSPTARKPSTMSPQAKNPSTMSPPARKSSTMSPLPIKAKRSRCPVADVHINHPENVDIYAVHDAQEYEPDQGYGNGYMNNGLNVNRYSNIPMAHKRSYIPDRRKISYVPDARTVNYNYANGPPLNNYAMEMVRQRAEEYEQANFQNFVAAGGASGRRRAASLQPRNYGI
uniref:GLOBIN domain-containing protein n=1 Tax=Panagrellus redivivus TaxID=6233 RepID=A0A7E4ZQU4_PANRE